MIYSNDSTIEIKNARDTSGDCFDLVKCNHNSLISIHFGVNRMGDPINSEKIYNRVDELRLQKGWSVYELAKRAGVTQNTLYRWKSKKSSPTLYLLENLAGALNISVVHLLIDHAEFVDSTAEQQDLLNKWNMLTDDQRKTIFSLICIFIKK